jgi:steroid delta-isomerase-like uncharacterized protein
MTTIEANKSVVTEFIEALFTQGELDVVERLLSSEFVNHDPPLGFPAGREGMRAVGAVFRSAFPDWNSTPHLLVAESDLVVEHFTAGGSHRGEFMGVAATGRAVTIRGINIFRLRDGLITERWGRLDELGFLRQLGELPEIRSSQAHPGRPEDRLGRRA